MIIILNFKTYPESLGENAINLASAAYKFANETGNKVIVCPQSVDIENILEKFPQTNDFEIWSQHVDYQEGGKETGYITAETLKKIGVKGSLVNHAEHKIGEIDKYSSIDDMLDLCLCVTDVFELTLSLSKNPSFTPRYIAYEPPNLIGGDYSVSEANPNEIQDIVDKFSYYEVLVGAGIKSPKDVKKSLELGAKGILISSGYIFSKDKFEFLSNLTS